METSYPKSIIKLDIEQWSGFLYSLGFKKKDFMKIMQYIVNHTQHETIQSFYDAKLRLNTSYYKDIHTLPLALRVLSQIDLKNVEFVESPVSENGVVQAVAVCRKHGMMDKFCAEDETELVEQTVKLFKKRINEDYKIYVYLLFSEITDDNIRTVGAHHRAIWKKEMPKIKI